MTKIKQNIQTVRERIQHSCHTAGRNAGSVALLAVSKTAPPEAVLEAMEAGQRDFAENYVAEGVEKILYMRAHLQQLGQQNDLQWHCIGPIQSNKTRLVAEHFDWVHTLDRLKTAQRLNEQRPLDAKRLQVCIQVNIDGSLSKSGVPPEDVFALAQEITKLPRLQLRGIMAIPDQLKNTTNTTNNIANKSIFTSAREVFNRLNDLGYGLDTLSIGMSADLEPAIEAGSTMVRVGTAIFGSRT
jgi:PLP dependent protein